MCLQIYLVVSSVETINSGKTGNTEVPQAVETMSSNIVVDLGNILFSTMISESSIDTGMKCVEPMRARLLMHTQMEFSEANLVVVFTMLDLEMEKLR